MFPLIWFELVLSFIKILAKNFVLGVVFKHIVQYIFQSGSIFLLFILCPQIVRGEDRGGNPGE